MPNRRVFSAADVVDALILPFVDNGSGGASASVPGERSRGEDMRLLMPEENLLMWDMIEGGCWGCPMRVLPWGR